MVKKLSQLEQDLTDPKIPIFPPLVLAPEVVERARNKAMKLSELALGGTDIQKVYPDAYNAMLADLWSFAQDFDTYTSYVSQIIWELNQLRESSWREWLERSEYTPFYGRAKFRSALVIFAQDPEKLQKVKEFIDQYRLASWQVIKDRKDVLARSKDIDEWHADLCDE